MSLRCKKIQPQTNFYLNYIIANIQVRHKQVPELAIYMRFVDKQKKVYSGQMMQGIC